MAAQATSRINPKPKKGDALTWKRAIAAAVLLVGLVAIGRTHPGVARATGAMSGLLLVACVDVLHGRKRTIAGTAGAIGWVYYIGLVTPLGWWLLTPVLALVYTTWAIGWKGTIRRTNARISSGFKDAAKHLPPGVKQIGKPEVNGRVTRIKFGLPIEATGFSQKDAAAAALRIAQASGSAGGQVKVNTLHHEKAGTAVLEYRNGKPFEFPDPAYPELKDWPKGKFPLAWDADGDTVWLNMSGTNGKHMVIAGRTGSGKTNTQRVILRGMVQLRIALRLIDPHGEFHDYADHVQNPEHYATSAEAGAKLLAELVKDMRARLADKSLPRGPICCMVDEAPAVLAIKGAEANANALAMEGRKVGIVLVFAVQYPTVDLFGGALRQQMSTVIVHRVKDRTGSNVALGQGAVGDGWDASDKRLLARQGRAIAELEGADDPRQFIQVFEAPPAPAVEVEPEPLPAPSPLPPPVAPVTESVRPSVRPPSGCTEQGEQPRTDGRTDNPTDATLKGLEAKLWPELNGHPRTNKELADVIGASTSGTHDALKRLRDKGLAVFAGDGWQRADGITAGH